MGSELLPTPFHAEVLAVFQAAAGDVQNVAFEKIRKVMSSGVARKLIAPGWTIQLGGPGKAGIKWVDLTGVDRKVTIEPIPAEDQLHV